MNCINCIIHQLQKKLKVNHDILSKYCSNITNNYKIKVVNVNELVPNLDNLSKPVNKKVIGEIQDEFKEKIISAFVGLKSKMYYLIDLDDEENKKAK